MTAQEVLDEIKRLSLDERLMVLEALSRDIHESAALPNAAGSSAALGNNISNLTHEEARQKLLTAGILSTAHHLPENAELPSQQERERVWKLFSQGRSSDEIIDEDRGEY